MKLKIFYLDEYTEGKEGNITTLIQITKNWYKPVDELGLTFDVCMENPNKGITMALRRLDESKLLLSYNTFDSDSLDDYQKCKLYKFIDSQTNFKGKEIKNQTRIVEISKEYYETTLNNTDIQSIIESYNCLYPSVYDDYFCNYVKLIGMDNKLKVSENIDKFEL